MERRQTVRTAMVVLLQALAAQAAVVVVDDFEAGLSAWTIDGSVRSVTQAANQIAALEEPGAGSRSRLYRPDIAVPTTPTHLSFRYYFSSAPGTRETAVPPDSFSAYFTDAAGARLIVPGGTSDPKFSSAFFYADSDGELLYDPTYVTVSPQRDAAGLYTVALQVPSIGAAGPLRIEFGLDGAGNGITSFAFLDDVQFGCPAAFCCNPTTGGMIVLDDYNPCTEDVCINGQVTHPAIDCSEECANCTNVLADVVIMVDRTDSTSEQELTDTRNGAKDVLKFFATTINSPSVAIGTIHSDPVPVRPATVPPFGCQDYYPGNPPRFAVCDSWARIVSGDGLTSFYGDDDAPPAADGDLFAMIDSIEYMGLLNNQNDPNREHPWPYHGGSDLSEAVRVAAEYLYTFGTPTHRKYILLVTQGRTMYPRTGESCRCPCDTANAAFIAQAQAARNNGIGIFVLQYGSSSCGNDPNHPNDQDDDPEDATAFLRENIVSEPADQFLAYAPSSGEIACNLFSIAQVIACDDGDPTTLDCCIDSQCQSGAACLAP